MTPPTVAHRYVDAVNSGDLSRVEAVFSDDAVFRSPGAYIEGIDNVLAYYQEVVLLALTALHLIEEFPSPRGHVARIDARSPLDPDLAPLEVFIHFVTNDDGEITSFDSFHRFDPASNSEG